MAEKQPPHPQSVSPAMEDKSSNPPKDVKSSVPLMKQVYDSLKTHDKINLFGPLGVGKTRMAKIVSQRATRSITEKLSESDTKPTTTEKLFDVALWVFMCRKYTRDSLLTSIARQLSIIPANEEWEVEDDKNEQERHHVEVPDTLTQRIEMLTQRIHKMLDDNKIYKILVILEDVVDGTTITSNEKEFWSVWKQIFPSTNEESLNPDFKITTVLISRLRREDKDFSEENAFEVKPLPRDVSINFLEEKLDPPLPEKVHNLGKMFIEKFSGDLPGTVIMIAKVLNHFCLDESGVSFLEKELEEASENYRLSKLLCMMHDVLPLGVLKDLWWGGEHFYRDSGSVHYSELISYWILEGYLGDGSMLKLYKKGHDVIMELIDCGMLKMQEGGYVFMDKSPIHVDDLYQCVDQNPGLGFATAITSENEGFGRLTFNDGKLKTTRTRRKKKDSSLSLSPAPPPTSASAPASASASASAPAPALAPSTSTSPSPSPSPSPSSSSDKYSQDLVTLLLDGTHATERVITSLFESEQKLQVFGLFYPTIKSLPKELEKMNSLRVLILRGCEFLKDAKPTTLHALEFLEISGARDLKKLTSSFFKNMLKLKSLHISGLPIKTLPQAIYSLPNIQWLIIKDCPNLKKLDSLSKLHKLIVVDLSGNLALDTLDKNFLKFENLQSLNLSKTRVSTTPLLKNRTKLNHLLCRECPSLVRLRGLSSLTSLQTIDLSGSKDFEEFHDLSLESLKSLITLNLSETGIDRLPSNISKPRYLYLKSCLKLTRLLCIVSFELLEVLDLSGSKNLNDIENKFFDDMKCVRVLNLSKTNISHIPSLSNLCNLRELFLSHCHSLTDIPSLESATKLEILDASNCLVLQDIQSDSFGSMTRLQKIDFSETKIESLPSLPNPCNLRQLLLKKCNALKNLELKGPFPNLEELNLSGIESLDANGAEFVKGSSSLRILNLSHTSIKQLPSLSKLTNLTHLYLAGCQFSSETELINLHDKIEVLDLSHSSIKSLPNGINPQKLMLKGCLMKEKLDDDIITKFNRLEYIEYPENNVESTPEEANQDEWNICELSDNEQPPVFRSATQFLKRFPPKTGSYHVCAVPIEVEGEKTWDTYVQRHELVFQDVYLQTCRFRQYKEKKSLQLHGLNQFLKGFEIIIKDVELVFLIDCKLNGFPSGFNPSMFSNLKGCWIERCNEMINIFTEKEGNDEKPVFDIRLKDLGICNNTRLISIYSGKQPFGSFDDLTSLYIDSCPELTTVFSSWLPKKLQVLEIKYCDKITGFGGELPDPLEKLIIWECPKMNEFEGEFEIPIRLKTLSISGATNLKNFITKNKESISLETIKVKNCPLLEYLVSSTSLMRSIGTIEIKSCEKIQILFKDINQTWLDLKKLHLEELPMLKQIGPDFRLSSSSPVDLFIGECPILQLPVD